MPCLKPSSVSTEGSLLVVVDDAAEQSLHEHGLVAIAKNIVVVEEFE